MSELADLFVSYENNSRYVIGYKLWSPISVSLGNSKEMNEGTRSEQIIGLVWFEVQWLSIQLFLEKFRIDDREEKGLWMVKVLLRLFFLPRQVSGTIA